MGLNPCNHPLKVWKSIRIPIPKMGAHLGVWRFIPSHSLTIPRTWNVTPRLHFWSKSFTSPCHSCKPKVRVTTFTRHGTFFCATKCGVNVVMAKVLFLCCTFSFYHFNVYWSIHNVGIVNSTKMKLFLAVKSKMKVILVVKLGSM
jgi:hypothetical protein